MFNLIVLYAGIVFAIIDAAVAGTCMNGWSRYENSCYHVSSDSASWAEAVKMCEIHQSKLVLIENGTEQGFIANMLSSVRHGSDFWIGGSNWNVPNEWVWEPMGTLMTYTKWHRGQPDSHRHPDHTCAAIRHALTYDWASLDCQERIHYVCEMSMGVAQEVMMATPS